MNPNMNNFMQPNQFNNYGFPRINYSSIPGRIINNFQDMCPQDVPMDGSWAVFPESGMQNVYLKFWDKDCNLQTVKFVREQVEQPVVEETVETKDEISPEISEILDRLTALEENLAKLEKPKTTATSKATAKGKEE